MSKKIPYSLTSLSLLFGCLLAILGSISYLVIGLPLWSRIGITAIALITTYYLRHFFPKENQLIPEKPKTYPLSVITIIAGYFCLCFFSLYQLFQARTDLPLISPWEVLPASQFISYGLASALLLYLLPQIKKTISLLLLVFHFIWSFCVALIIYVIGYGFDPFIHQATVQAIERLGQVQPLTIYYLGQYSLVTIFHTFLGWSIAAWDKLLVPGLAAVILPLILYYRLKSQFSQVTLILVSLLLLPTSLFIVTTPQNLAYLLLIIIVAWSLKLVTVGDYILISLLALVTLFTQPIAGIPAIIFTSWLIIQKYNFITWKKTINYLISLLFITALPAAFYWFNYQNYHHSLSLIWPSLENLWSSLVPKNPIQETWYLNLVYFFEAGRTWLYLGLMGTGAYLAYIKKEKIMLIRYGLPTISLICSALLASSINFQYLIDYERYDYPERIITVAVIFSLPFLLLAWEAFFIRLTQQTLYIRVAIIILLAGLLTGAFYLRYPRFDHYFNSHGYATSQADIEAVQWIETKAENRPYIVLANQQVSAAAIREFGFAHYYNNLFYYPVPTGGPLYQYYLDLVKKPDYQTVAQAMELTGVNEAYVVLNNYWWAADKLGPELEMQAKESISLHNKAIRIYWFTKQ